MLLTQFFCIKGHVERRGQEILLPYRWISQIGWHGMSTSWALSTATRQPPGVTKSGADELPTHTFLTSSEWCCASGDIQPPLEKKKRSVIKLFTIFFIITVAKSFCQSFCFNQDLLTISQLHNFGLGSKPVKSCQ